MTDDAGEAPQRGVYRFRDYFLVFPGTGDLAAFARLAWTASTRVRSSYVEDSGRWIYHARTFGFSPDAAEHVQAVAAILDPYGRKDRWVFHGWEGFGSLMQRAESM